MTLLGVSTWVGSILFFEDTLFKPFLNNLGVGLIVTAIAFLVLTYVLRGIEMRFAERLERITERLPVLAGAQKSGIVNIFSSRHNDENYPKEIKNQCENIENEATVYTMSISMRDWLGQHPEDIYNQAFVHLLDDKKVRIRILLLDPTSGAAKARAVVENRDEINRYGYHECRLFREIFHVIRTLVDADRFSREIKERIKTQVEVRFYRIDPTTHLLMSA